MSLVFGPTKKLAFRNNYMAKTPQCPAIRRAYDCNTNEDLDKWVASALVQAGKFYNVDDVCVGFRDPVCCPIPEGHTEIPSLDDSYASCAECVALYRQKFRCDTGAALDEWVPAAHVIQEVLKVGGICYSFGVAMELPPGATVVGAAGDWFASCSACDPVPCGQAVVVVLVRIEFCQGCFSDITGSVQLDTPDPIVQAIAMPYSSSGNIFFTLSGKIYSIPGCNPVNQTFKHCEGYISWTRGGFITLPNVPNHIHVFSQARYTEPHRDCALGAAGSQAMGSSFVDCVGGLLVPRAPAALVCNTASIARLIITGVS